MRAEDDQCRNEALLENWDMSFLVQEANSLIAQLRLQIEDGWSDSQLYETILENFPTVREMIAEEVREDLQREMNQLEKKLQEDYRSGAVLELLEKRFFAEEGFRRSAIDQLRRDIAKTAEAGRLHKFYGALIEKCGPDLIIQMLLESYHEQTLQALKPEIIKVLRDERKQEFLHEIREQMKLEMRNNREVMASIKSELLAEVSGRLFADT